MMMPINITAEQQKLIDDVIKAGIYKTPAQVIGRALEILAHEEELLGARRDFIREKIERGLAQADRGEVISEDEFLSRFEDHRAAYIAQTSNET